MKKLLAATFVALLMVGCGEESAKQESEVLRKSPPPPEEIVVIVAEDFVGTYEVEVDEWGPAKLVFLENGLGEYHNTLTLGSKVITIRWKIVDEGFVKWECKIEGVPFSAVYRHNPDGSITDTTLPFGMGTFKKTK
jgi:hypothetical protein